MLFLLAAVVVSMLTAGTASSQSPSASSEIPASRCIRVSLPLRGSEDRLIKQMIQRVIDEQPQSSERPVLVLEFTVPRDSDGRGTEFGRALELANFLTRQDVVQRLRTVAFIPQKVVGHGVLVAIACEEIAMASEATLGDAGIDEDSLGPAVRGGYTEIAHRRLTVPEAVALGMLDSELNIYRITTAGGVLYARQDQLDQLRNERNDIREVTTLLETGRSRSLRGAQWREYGLISYVVPDRTELAVALGLNPEQLQFDPSMGETWRAMSVELYGPISSTDVQRVIRAIQQQRENADVNFVCLKVNSPGGSLSESVQLANYLADLDESRIRTVAFVEKQALADAVLPVWACDHVVVQTGAKLGGPGAITINTELIDDLRGTLKRIAKQKHKPWSLVMAMFDRDTQVFEYRRPGSNVSWALSEEEFAMLFPHDVTVDRSEDEAAGDASSERTAPPKQGPEITSLGETLQLSSEQALSLGMAQYEVDRFAELLPLYQLADEPALIGPNWAIELIDALASPQFSGALLFVGMFALVVELSAPGIGVGGFLASLCFLMFFWSNFLNGTAEFLEILLFVAGLVFLALEIFALPGFGIFGIGGAAMILVSLVLASQTFAIPTNDYQVAQLTRSFLPLLGAVAGVIGSTYFLRRYLHRTPFLNRMVLIPPSGEDLEDLSRRETVVSYDDLLGRTGVARTRLTPSGKAMIDDELVSVVTDGGHIDKGQPIRVIAVTGNRIEVELAEDRSSTRSAHGSAP